MRTAVLILLASSVFVAGGVAPSAADPIGPIVAVAPGTGHGQALKFEVPDAQGAQVWANILINPPVSGVLNVSFDVYRPGSAVSTQNFGWGWDQPSTAATPTLGYQNDAGWTSPLYWDTTSPNTTTLYGQWVHVSLAWDFPDKTVTGSYGGYSKTYAFTGATSSTDLGNWGFILSHDKGTGTGSDVAWIDNLSITDAILYSSNFDTLRLGALDGQDGWTTGATTPVPEPTSLLLFATGLAGFAGRAWRKRRG